MSRRIELQAMVPSYICVKNNSRLNFKEQAFEIFKYLMTQVPSGTYDEFKDNFEKWYEVFLANKTEIYEYNFEEYNPPTKKESDFGCP